MKKYVPNALTLMRVPLMLLIAVLGEWVQQGLYLWIIFLFLLGTMSDFLDGFLARRWKVESAFGKVADPLLDKFFLFGMIMWMLGMGILETLHLPIILLLFLRELAVTGLRGGASSAGGFGADWFGKWKTALLFAALLLVLVENACVHDFAMSGTMVVFLGYTGRVLLWLGAVLGIYSGFRYFNRKPKHT